jgi:hypothetical protein
MDTERQMADIFTKPLDSSQFADLRGGLIFAIRMAWFEGGLSKWFYDTSTGAAPEATRCGSFAGKVFSLFGC